MRQSKKNLILTKNHNECNFEVLSNYFYAKRRIQTTKKSNTQNKFSLHYKIYISIQNLMLKSIKLYSR
jgi:hypothetical protein